MYCVVCGIGDEISKGYNKFAEKGRYHQANSNPDTRTASCVSSELKLLIMIIFQSSCTSLF